MANPTSPATPTVPGVVIRPVAAAPPVRTRPPRPEKRPEIKLSEAKVESRFIGPLPLALGAIALAATLGLAHRVSSKTEDPNYLMATESVNQYELGLPEPERNYDSPIYAEALDSLAKVDPDSISVEKAGLLATDIKSRVELFHRRIAARTQAELTIQNSRSEIDKEFMRAYQRDLLMQKKSYPECHEGEQAHEH
jgi:hypothetical protein